MRKYLILGASSDLAWEFLQKQNFSTDDEAILQYRTRNEKLEQFAAEKNFQLAQADFEDVDSTKNFAEKLRAEKFVPTHILHIPAARIENKHFTEYDWQDFERQINVQLRSLFFVLKSVIKSMARAKFGKIVLILTEYTLNVPPKFLASYVASKYALMGLGKALAIEYAPKNIQVNMISPAMMETKFLSEVYSGVVEQTAASNPMKRNAKVSDVVPLIQYFFAEENNFVTGVNVPIAGGEVF